ncbi:MAG: riboflavin synthase [Bacteroidetes bacterium]|nr:riboflavin synthase [Bacteroidota bacterium]
MFTGIIESMGTIESILPSEENLSFIISSPISRELKPDQSVAHNGVCLTVESVEGNQHRITAVKETLDKTNLGSWKVHDKINLERCLSLSDRLDGHIVQGHVDCTGICIQKSAAGGSWVYSFEIPKEHAGLIVEKGSICLNGISLTLFDVQTHQFSVTIIPYTFEHTSIQQVEVGHQVNIEFDIIGKYILRNEILRTRP